MQTIYNIIDALLPFSFLEHTFMKNALLAVLLIAPLLGLLGTLVVSNKMAFFADTLGHSALTGIAVGTMLGIGDAKISMIVLGLIIAVCLVLVKGKNRAPTDTTISVFSSTVSALGIVLLSKNGGFAKYTNFLIGDFLSVSASDLLLAVIILSVVILYWIFLFNKTYIVSVNPTFAHSLGINTRAIELLFTCLVAVVVMTAISWVGILIITSLLVLPAATARIFSSSIKSYTIVSVMLSLASGIFGLVLSYYMGSATGATIVLVLAVCYFTCLAFFTKQ